MILMYSVKYQRRAEGWFFFSFQLDIYNPVRMDRKFKKNPYRFCCICEVIPLPNHRAKINDFVKKAYRDYFGMKLGDQDKPFAPHICWKTCAEDLKDWRNG